MFLVDEFGIAITLSVEGLTSSRDCEASDNDGSAFLRRGNVVQGLNFSRATLPDLRWVKS